MRNIKLKYLEFLKMAISTVIFYRNKNTVDFIFLSIIKTVTDIDFVTAQKKFSQKRYCCITHCEHYFSLKFFAVICCIKCKIKFLANFSNDTGNVLANSAI